MGLETIEIATGAAPRASVIVLHGLGADGKDFVPVAQQLELASVGALRFVLPHAPVRPVTINGGLRMRAWYDVLASDLVRREDEAGLRESCAQIQALIEQEIARGVAPGRIVLMGFSQGCALTLMAGLRAPQRLAGLAGLSGYLPLAPQTAAERSAANATVPVFLAHGRQDPVVSFAQGIATREALTGLGYAVQWHEYAMQHAVCTQEIHDLNRFLVAVLALA